MIATPNPLVGLGVVVTAIHLESKIIEAKKMTNADSAGDKDIDMDKNKPLDLKGSEQHHQLKDQEGEHGDPDHTEGAALQSAKTKDVVAEGDGGTAIGDAFKSVSKEAGS